MIWVAKRPVRSTPETSQPATESEDQLHLYDRRWAGGDSIAGLAKEAGMSWNRLWSELTKLGYTKGA